MRKGIIIFLLLLPCFLFAQKDDSQPRYSISTNMMDYLSLGTINLEAGVSVSKNITLTLEGKYNPFTYNKGKANQVQNRRITTSLGVKIWPWFTNSSWFFTTAAQAEVYNYGGFFYGETSQEGFRYGIGLGAGYALMLTKYFNIEFGIGAWCGWEQYTKYACVDCGKIIKQGESLFVRPHDISISFVFLF